MLNNCTLTGNSAPIGGGAEQSTLYNCTLTGNSASEGGAGADGCTLCNCAVTGNGGHESGGAEGCTLYNCTVTGNGTTWFAGVSGCTLYNCIVYFNTSWTSGGQENDVGSCTLYYCCTPSLTNASFPLTIGAGNITNAPLFVDYASGNLRLQPDSPCIDAGNVAYAPPGPVDLDGNPRIVDGTVDMGAYEFQGPRNGPPVLLSQPASVTNEAGTTVTFSVEAGGSRPLSFQWLMDGLPLADGGNREGTGTAVLTLTNVLGADAGGYSAVVSNQYGSVTSAVALLTVNGSMATLDSGFDPGANSIVNSVALQADGRILVGGFFTMLGGQSCNYIGRLNADGTLDTSFNPGADYVVYSLALQADGKILMGGQFGALGGQSRYCIGRLNADGTLDTSFNPGAGGLVYSLALQADGKILVGGGFTTLGGQSRSCIGRLNADGTVDTSFNPGAGGGPGTCVYSLALQPDGKILVGGWFTTLGGQSRECLGRLNADGTVDTSFNPGEAGLYSALVLSLAVQADGKILVGGSFLIGRLNADGTVDSSFSPGVNSDVGSLAVQADGKILVGGSFTTLGGQSRNCIGRLNADGTVDMGFNPGSFNPLANGGGGAGCLALQADGKILVGGRFPTLGGQIRTNIGRLNNTAPATQSLAFDGSAITWLRGGASPEVWRTTFDFSTNGTDWASLGAGARIAGPPAGQAGGWQLTGVSLPPAIGTIRARGYVTGGGDQGSAWFVESDLVLGAPPVILVNDPSFGFTSNRFGFKLSGTAGQVVIVEASPNLAAWTPVATNTLGATPLYFSEPYSGGFPRRFYRLRVGP